jgi:hypothetical protein
MVGVSAIWIRTLEKRWKKSHRDSLLLFNLEDLMRLQWLFEVPLEISNENIVEAISGVYGVPSLVIEPI